MKYQLKVIPYPEPDKDYPEEIIIGEGELPDEMVAKFLKLAKLAEFPIEMSDDCPND